MNISFDWLKEYVDLGDMTPEQLDDLLTFSGLEVDSREKVETVKGGLEHVVIAQVMTCEPHPDSDHLHLTTVDVGGERPLNIVCGAPNVAAGQKVVCARIGAKIYTSDTEFYEIKKGKLRGAVSEGMLCAADELQLGHDHDGIMVLPADAPVGMPAKEYFGVKDDCLLDVAITANRMDAISHIGVARDVVAVRNTREGMHLKLKWPEVADDLTPTTAGEAIKVTVEDADLCPRYTGITLRNVRVGESPQWLQDRLRTVGLRPINNIVDVTNFVMMEVGQPLHAFDADRIGGGHVVVRCLPQGTKFVTLDGVERELDKRDLMICDEHEGMCIAGVFGGQKSGVTMETRNVFLECAYFNPVSIRKTSQRHTLKTDASYRYERTCDPNITEWALRRAVKLVRELAGGDVCGAMVDLYPQPIEKPMVEVSFRRVFDLAGQEIPVESIRTILTSLDIEIAREDAEGMTLRVPTCKADVTRECDIVEEIMRIYGYNNIHVDERVNSCLSYSSKPNPRRLQNVVSDYLSDNGFSEIMNNSLTKSAYYTGNADFPEDACVAVVNPLSKELNVMRQTLLYGGLECVVRNLNHRILDQRLYEFGRSYSRNAECADDLSQPVTKRYVETRHLSLWMTGDQYAESWKVAHTPTDFFFLKSYVMNILRRMRVNISCLESRPTTCGYLSDGVDFLFRDSRKRLLSMGVVSKQSLNLLDCKQPVFYADIDWDLLLKSYPSKEVTYCDIPRFPEVRRDLALVLDNAVTFEQIEQVAYATERKLLRRVGLFDVYDGKGIAAGMKSYAVSFVLQSPDKTLTDKQIDGVMERIRKNLESQLGAKLR
ncbi:MAG: phenylalanyl-tRNA synthetase beta chain [bacterium P3]|nr:MAG: phenylalanyl-tRNA synthetase beta chain [bacterium P3]KWW41999.1 MAG: phenylalanyl-tRNA synthetase beta chain [bacterium F083]